MIMYKGRGLYFFLKIFQFRGSVFPSSALVALPCALLTAALKWAIDRGVTMSWMGEASITLTNNAVWSSFSFLVGFLVVFRSSQAYMRFWEGCTSIFRMRAEWYEACSAVISFSKCSKADEMIVMRFQHTLVRLFSMLHALALAEIEDSNCLQLEDIHAFKLPLIDGLGISHESLIAIHNSDSKVELVYQWIQQLVVQYLDNGVLTVPAPILSRVFERTGNGMMSFYECIKISSVPFPFPYAQTCDFLLMVHWVVVPVVTVHWVTSPWWAGFISFVQVLCVWCLNFIAVEMENPFGHDANDMDMDQMQLEMNRFLLLLLCPEAARTPTLSEDAQTNFNVLNRMKKSVGDCWAEVRAREEQAMAADRNSGAFEVKSSNTLTNRSAPTRSVRSSHWRGVQSDAADSDSSFHPLRFSNLGIAKSLSNTSSYGTEKQLSSKPVPSTKLPARSSRQSVEAINSSLSQQIKRSSVTSVSSVDCGYNAVAARHHRPSEDLQIPEAARPLPASTADSAASGRRSSRVRFSVAEAQRLATQDHANHGSALLVGGVPNGDCPNGDSGGDKAEDVRQMEHNAPRNSFQTKGLPVSRASPTLDPSAYSVAPIPGNGDINVLMVSPEFQDSLEEAVDNGLRSDYYSRTWNIGLPRVEASQILPTRIPEGLERYRPDLAGFERCRPGITSFESFEAEAGGYVAETELPAANENRPIWINAHAPG